MAHSGKVAIITGASAGIGRASASLFARQGIRVVLSDVDGKRGEEAAEAIRREGGEARFVRADVSRPPEVKTLVEQTVSLFGRLDYAFNNAGVEGTPASTHECTEENWDRTIAINLKGVWLCMKYEIEQMLKQKSPGAIVNNSSVAGLVGFSNIPAYVASKHGIVGLTKTAALEYATQGIRVNAVCPGVIQTEMVERFHGGNQEAAQQLLAMEPVGRLGRPEEIGEAALWLCSSAASFVTGQALAVDGGLTVR